MGPTSRQLVLNMGVFAWGRVDKSRSRGGRGRTETSRTAPYTEAGSEEASEEAPSCRRSRWLGAALTLARARGSRLIWSPALLPPRRSIGRLCAPSIVAFVPRPRRFEA